MGKKRKSHSKRSKNNNMKILGLVIGIVVAGVFVSSLSSITIIQGTAKSMIATSMADSSLELYIDGQLVDTGSPANGKTGIPADPAIWIDPAGHRVSIMAYTSDSWLSDWDGTPLPNGTYAASNLNWSLTVSNASGYIQEAVFQHVIYNTVEVVIRTGPAAVFNFVPTVHYLTPFAGTLYSGAWYQSKWAGEHATEDGLVDDGVMQSWPIYGDSWWARWPSRIYGEDVKGALTSIEWIGTGTYNALSPPGVMWQTNVMDTPFNSGQFQTANGHSPPSWNGGYPDKGDSRQAKITTSLVPVSFPNVDGARFDLSTQATILPDGSSMANQYVKYYMAGDPVDATVKLNVKGNSQTAKAYNVDYPFTLKNGTVVNVHVNTTNAVVGFSGSDPQGHNGTVGSTPATGLVPNINPATRIPTFDLTKRSDVKMNDPNEYNDWVITQTRTDNGVTTLSGGIDVKSYAFFDTQSANAVSSGYSASNTVIKNIDLTDVENGCGIPDNLNISDMVNMRPKITVADAYAYVAWSRSAQIAHDEFWSVKGDSDWHSEWYSANIAWPYGVNQTNAYYVRNFTYPVDIISEREAQAFDSKGHPIPLSSIFDNVNNSFFHDPRADKLNVTQISIDLTDPCNRATSLFDISSWGNGISCWWNHWWWVFAAIGAFAVAAIAIDLYAKIKRRH
nr:hypothetical protein [Candidatus Sigynarchaeota archaeon]